MDILVHIRMDQSEIRWQTADMYVLAKSNERLVTGETRRITRHPEDISFSTCKPNTNSIWVIIPAAVRTEAISFAQLCHKLTC